MYRQRMALQDENMEIRRHQYSFRLEESPTDFITDGMTHFRSEFESNESRAVQLRRLWMMHTMPTTDNAYWRPIIGLGGRSSELTKG